MRLEELEEEVVSLLAGARPPVPEEYANKKFRAAEILVTLACAKAIDRVARAMEGKDKGQD